MERAASARTSLPLTASVKLTAPVAVSRRALRREVTRVMAPGVLRMCHAAVVAGWGRTAMEG